MTSYGEFPLNGALPAMSSNSKIPSAQMSIL